MLEKRWFNDEGKNQIWTLMLLFSVLWAQRLQVTVRVPWHSLSSWGNGEIIHLFTLLAGGPGHSTDLPCCLLSFQRLVEAAEEAHLKHEFDADLQVTDSGWVKFFMCWLPNEKHEVCWKHLLLVPGRERLSGGWNRVGINVPISWWGRVVIPNRFHHDYYSW